jgi:hypothetical protein
MACATYHAAPPYPTVVAVKLSTISAPNGVAGLCGKLGPDRECQETRRVAYRTESHRHDDGCRRRESQVLKEQKEDEKLLFCVDVMSTTKWSLASRRAARIGWSGYCP